ncbi:MAG: hypothetical protein EB069_06140, partial [Actinobacteria bacterium]|nr:hypothetical protein [Actinomycetota bacterium]
CGGDFRRLEHVPESAHTLMRGLFTLATLIPFVFSQYVRKVELSPYHERMHLLTRSRLSPFKNF